MTDTTEDLRLTLSRHLDAPVERVYQAWLDPALLVRFMGNPQRAHLARAETDPRVGGRFVLVMNNGEKDIDHTGTYLQLTPHSRIAFTWQSPYSTAEGSTVTLDLVPEAEGTHLTLTHVRFASESSRDGHRSGWATILDGLAAASL
jgi:uncharacterized protein YndB with AHSA1/START domain